MQRILEKVLQIEPSEITFFYYFLFRGRGRFPWWRLCFKKMSFWHKNESWAPPPPISLRKYASTNVSKFWTEKPNRCIHEQLKIFSTKYLPQNKQSIVFVLVVFLSIDECVSPVPRVSSLQHASWMPGREDGHVVSVVACVQAVCTQ